MSRYREGQRFLINEKGEIEFDSSIADLHGDIPLYYSSQWVLHGHIRPDLHAIEIIDLSVPSTNANNNSPNSYAMQKLILPRLKEYMAPALKKLLKQGDITPNWLIETFFSDVPKSQRVFTVRDALRSVGAEDTEGHEDDYEKMRDRMGKNTVNNYLAKNYAKDRFKNKEQDPSGWFGRYEENTNKLDRFCAWCNRRINNDNQAEGPVIPKDQQQAPNATHGVCVDCFKEMMKDQSQ